MSDLDWQPVAGHFFVGEAQLAMHTDTPACSVGEVAFTAGCRNNWHTHPVAQILVVTAGRGLYQEEGQPARLLLPGQVVYTGSGVNHWHGACPETAMTHLAITLKDEAGQQVVWGKEVSQEVYTQAAQEASKAWRQQHDPQQTAGQQQLGGFAPQFAELNDEVLFGKVWSRTDLLSARDRSLVTVISLIAQGITDNSLKYHLQTARANGITAVEISEAITHVAFYAGWPKAWAAFNLAKEVWA